MVDVIGMPLVYIPCLFVCLFGVTEWVEHRNQQFFSLDFAVEHWSGCRATEPGFAGDIGAIKVWLIVKNVTYQRVNNSLVFYAGEFSIGCGDL